MARITVEDCVLKVPNRFKLVLIAAQRAREVAAGSPLTIERDNDKNPVVSLREIADGTIQVEDMYQHLLQNLQKHVEKDEPEEDNPELLGAGDDLISLETRRSLIDEEIADEVLTVGGQVLIGADDDDDEGEVEGDAMSGDAAADSDAAENPGGEAEA